MSKIIYEEVTTDFGSVVIKRTNADGSETWIPTDPANSDYQAYLNPDKVEHLTEIVADETPTK